MATYDERHATTRQVVQREATHEGAKDPRKAELRGASFDEGEAALSPDKRDDVGKGPQNMVVKEVQGEAYYRPNGVGAELPVEAGKPLPPGAKVLARSDVRIVFSDGSDLTLGPDQLLVVYAGSVRKAKAKDEQKTQVLVKEGTVKGGLATLDAMSGGGADRKTR